MIGEGADGLLAVGVTGLLADFNTAGVLDVADVRTAQAVGRVGQESDERVLLALALTVRALRNGSVCVDLTQVDEVVFDEDEETVDLSGLPWPDPTDWLTACAGSALVTTGPDPTGGRPMRLTAGLLYLERYWLQEELVRTELQARFAADPPAIDVPRLTAGLARLFPGDPALGENPDQQRLAAAVAAAGWLTVVAGAPGTGKTTTVARLLALLVDQPGPAPRIALAAPTGKAAARLEEAVRAATAQLPVADRERLGEVTASTLHRLLGWIPATQGRFRHNEHNPLPQDVVIVDEMSMVSLTMTARLLEAVRPTARLILVGDPHQLSSVEAGAVLADIVAAPGAPSVGVADRLTSWGLVRETAGAPVHGVVQLAHTWRFGGAIADLARAIRDGDADAVITVLRSGAADVTFVETESSDVGAIPESTSNLRRAVVECGRRTHQAAVAGDAVQALLALEEHRLLCAHRRGPYGVARWSQEVERWLIESVVGYAEDGEWYLGRPLLVTANDYDVGLYNGDTGVIVHTSDGPRAAFSRGAEPSLHPPVRLDSIQTVHAMTVHRAQGSQFRTVSLITPPPESPLLTRELLYTAVTRASERVQIFGSEEAIRRAVSRPANRASGLRGRLSLTRDEAGIRRSQPANDGAGVG